MPLSKSKNASTQGSVMINIFKQRIIMSDLIDYKKIHPANNPFSKLVDLLLEINVASSTLLEGEIANYAGFYMSNGVSTFDYSKIDWNKLTYYIAFRIPFSNLILNKFFSDIPIPYKIGKWFQKVNEIRLQYWEQNSSSSVRRLCLNGEQTIFDGNDPSSVNNSILPIAKQYTTRGDYSIFYDLNNDSIFQSELKHSPEYYFGNVTNESITDDSEIPVEYYLTAQTENPYDVWQSYGSLPHVPYYKDKNGVKHYSGLTIGFGMDLGTSGISNKNNSDIDSQGNPNPNFAEFTLNYYLLNLSNNWKNNWTKKDKDILYTYTARGINNNPQNPITSLRNPQISASDKIKLGELNLAKTSTNSIGGWVNCLKLTVVYLNRLYFIGSNSMESPLTTIEDNCGLGSTKLIRLLQQKGLKTKPNVVEASVIYRIAMNNPLFFINSKNKTKINIFIEAINSHNLLKLYKAERQATYTKNNINMVARFITSQKVKDYYSQIHYNSIDELNQIV